MFFIIRYIHRSITLFKRLKSQIHFPYHAAPNFTESCGALLLILQEAVKWTEKVCTNVIFKKRDSIDKVILWRITNDNIIYFQGGSPRITISATFKLVLGSYSVIINKVTNAQF